MKRDSTIPADGSGDPKPPGGTGAWDSIVEMSQANNRRGFIALMGGMAFGAVGAGATLYRVVVPGPAPLLAEMCRGDVLAVRSLDMPAGRPALEDIAEDLKAWVRGAREVSFDRDFTIRQAQRTYNMTRGGSQAEVDLQDHHRRLDPVGTAKTKSVKVERQTAMAEGGRADSNVWLLEWRELHKGRDGVLISSTDWRCRATFVLNPPTTRDALEKSPHGVYVESYHWEAVPGRNAPARPGTQANRGGNG